MKPELMLYLGEGTTDIDPNQKYYYFPATRQAVTQLPYRVHKIMGDDYLNNYDFKMDPPTKYRFQEANPPQRSPVLDALKPQLPKRQSTLSDDPNLQ